MKNCSLRKKNKLEIVMIYYFEKIVFEINLNEYIFIAYYYTIIPNNYVHGSSNT